MAQAGIEVLQAGEVRTIVVPGLAPHTVPLSFFPEWVNDAGVQAFGGARYVSIWEDGVPEGTSTARVTGVDQQPIDTVGGVLLPAPDPAELYVIRIRLRTDVGDPNYVDRVARFRVLTPLLPPFAVALHDADDEPGVEHVLGSGAYRFLPVAGAFPSGEIRLRDGRGGVVLPSAPAVDWPAAAKEHVDEMLGRLRRGFFVVDFAAAAGVEADMQLVYYAELDASSGQVTVTRARRRDHSRWGYQASQDVDFLTASVDMVAQTATITFLRGLYSVGPRLEAAWVVGSGGTVAVAGQQAQVGGTIDVSAAVDFGRRSHLTRSGLQDDHLLFVATTPSAVYVREIPLRPTGFWEFVGQDGVTNYATAAFSTPLPSQPLLGCRILFQDYIEFPNLSMYYDPTQAFLASPVALPYPRLVNIRVFAANAAVPNVTYTDVLDLFAQMRTIRMPDVGEQRHVVDRRHLRDDAGPFTAIPPGTPFLRIIADVEPNDTDPAYEVEAWYDLNEDGQPKAWSIPSVLEAPDAPELAFDPVAHELTVTTALGSNIDPGTFVVRGDVGEAAFVPAVPGASVVPAATMRQVLSPHGQLVAVEYDVTGQGRFERRVAATAQSRLVQGDAGNEIGVIFAGGLVVFTNLAAVLTEPGGERVVALVGDGPPVTIDDAQVGVPYAVNLQGTSPVGSGGRRTWVDLLYRAGSPESVHRYRAFAVMLDGRGLDPRTYLFARPTAHDMGGYDFDLENFAAPALAFDLQARTVEVQDDSRVYAFGRWALLNPVTGARTAFSGPATAGRIYQVGDVLLGVSAGQSLVLVALHRSGAEKTFLVTVPASGYAQPRALTLRPNP